MMTKLSDNYRTPKALFDELNSVTSFFWDACCTKDNCLVKVQRGYFEKKPYFVNYLGLDVKLALENIRLHCSYYNHPLECPYHKEDQSIFINPPYSRGSVGPIIEKAWEDAKHFRVVMLLKADMSTKWFNELIRQTRNRVSHLNQDVMDLDTAYRYVLGLMQHDRSVEVENPWREEDQGDEYYAGKIGILHLRKRVKFLGDEEMMEADKEAWIDQEFHHTDYGLVDTMVDRNAYADGILIETKNFKRGSDGLIYPKSGPTFPSMLVIMDRRNV